MIEAILKWGTVAVALFPWSLVLWVVFVRKAYTRRYYPKTGHLTIVRDRDPEDFSC